MHPFDMDGVFNSVSADIERKEDSKTPRKRITFYPRALPAKQDFRNNQITSSSGNRRIISLHHLDRN
jgi:hypothetical protein